MLRDSIVALITPFKQGSVDYDALKQLILWQTTQQTQGLVLCGSTGEGVLLSLEERQCIIDLALSITNVPVIIGCNHMNYNSVKQQIKQAEQCAAVLVTPSPYIRPSQPGIIDFFKRLHDETEAHILLYNNPARCGVSMDTQTITTLFALPRIVGVKESSTDLSRLRPLVAYNNHKSILCGEDAMIPAYLMYGGNGFVSVCGNLIPDVMHKLAHATTVTEYQQWVQRMLPVVDILSLAGNPASIKCALSIHGTCQNELRYPLIPVPKHTEDMMRTFLYDNQDYCLQQACAL